MFTFKIEQFVPRFILNDRNGYAIAKAIEAGLRDMNAVALEGFQCVSDYDTMPEWRLDELAWEYNCLYDYGVDIEQKRAWIRDARPLYRLFGTPQAVYKYLSGYFDGIEVEENWQYDGAPYHFRVTCDGEWTPENEAWARKAIAAAKNVRSVLDTLRLGCQASIAIAATGEIKERIRFPSAGELYAGEYPIENIMWEIDETPRAAIDAHGEAQTIAYRMTGTYHDIARMLEIDGTPLEANEAQEIITPIYYPMCGENPCGE